jgi:hypothetical protein
MNETTTYLQDFTEAAQRIAGIDTGFFYSCPEEFVLQNGCDFEPKRLETKKYRYCKGGQCFYNTYRLILKHPELSYAEGYVTMNNKFTFLHAWAMDGTSVVDNTLRWTEDRFPVSYKGIVFPQKYVIETQIKNPYCGSLIDNLENGYPLLREKFDINSLSTDLK